MKKILCALTMLLWFGISYGQSRLKNLQHKLLSKYSLEHFNVQYYDKTDPLKGPLNLMKAGKKHPTNYADFIFFLDKVGQVKEIKLVNIEIIGNGITENRMLDWRTFIKESKYDAYDLHNDVGVTRVELAEIDMLPRTKKLANNLLKQLEDKIAFDIPPDIETPYILYSSFSF